MFRIGKIIVGLFKFFAWMSYIFIQCLFFFLFTAIHEKIFILFMICSLCHMLATIKLHGYIKLENDTERTALLWKKRLFIFSILSTIGLLFFFARHRFYCYDLAFSWFALSEYIIACLNLAFHCTAIWDFATEHMIIVKGADQLKLNHLRECKLE